MKYSKIIPSLLILASVLLPLLGGCAWLDKLRGSNEDKSPSELMYEGLSDLERGRYASATEAFQTIKDRYPYSELAVEAKLRMADTLYRRELYEEAYNAYDEFERLHPTNSAVPYAIYQKGMCHFNRMRGIDRDQTATRNARDQFERLIEKFPDSNFSAQARRKLAACYSSLVSHELFIADFYLKKKHLEAARDRYIYLLENYPDFGQYLHALENLQICMQKLKDQDQDSKSWLRKIIPFDHAGDRPAMWWW
jgi:outer membrane protein assembly factor BamD